MATRPSESCAIGTGSTRHDKDIPRYLIRVDHCRYCAGVGLVKDFNRAPHLDGHRVPFGASGQGATIASSRQPTVGGSFGKKPPTSYSDRHCPSASCFEWISV